MDHLIDPAFLTEYIPPPAPASTKSKSSTPPPARFPMARAKKTTSKAKKTSDPAIIIPTPSKTPINKTTDPLQNISEAIKDDLMTTTFVESKKAKPKKTKKDDDDDSSTRHIWTTAQQATFRKEIANGHTNGFSTNNGNLKKEGGRALTKKMLAKHGFAPTAGQIKNQKAFLRQTFVDVKFLHNQSGFGWDEDQSLVTADEDVWAELLEAHPRREFSKLKDKPFPVRA
ncbi:hypothetical protein PSTG_11604 [Puccinia striiformis f. sp. tritici PST-78]|uniref:Myb/SANT-like domain-containing protein n=1 Tax=Puccinia striiformis f. sp. tritici PST-78 TaxID=1165861 RepID=A0A0L0V775_9BASI|nr:hypothetical protein PSTG_11604 [Puccinia striiformis f. sp. tritici PST-78]